MLLALLIFIIAAYFNVKSEENCGVVGRGIDYSIPYILLVNYTILFVALLIFMDTEGLSLESIGWSFLPQKNIFWLEIIIDVVFGIILFYFEHFILARLRRAAQRVFGGYRLHSGENIKQTYFAWLIAGTVFAPIVEESIYRGYAITQLSPSMGTAWALVISSCFFGILHWGQGLWSIVTAMIMGVCYGGLFIWRQTLIAPAIAHAVFNTIIILKQSKRITVLRQLSKYRNRRNSIL